MERPSDVGVDEHSSDLPLDQGSAGKLGFSRRAFLIGVGATGVTAAMPDLLVGVAQAQLLAINPLPATLTRVARRREDMVSLTLEFRNLRLTVGNPPKLVKLVPGQPAYIGVVFPPQHLADQVYADNGSQPAPGNVPLRVAGPSRLVFQIDNNRLPMDFNIGAILAWQPSLMRVVPAAAGNGTPRVPRADETAIEIPWRLVLSPPSTLGWQNRTTALTQSGVTELWHTRLGRRSGPGMIVNPGDAEPVKTVRAVWATDPGFPNKPADVAQNCDNPTIPAGFSTSLTPKQRWDIVKLTTDATFEEVRQPVLVNNLMLSPLGGWLDSRGEWAVRDLTNPQVSVSEWRHRATMARDSYVRIVNEGFLVPLGHQAALVTISERKFRSAPGGGKGAYLFQRKFIIVRQQLKRYGSAQAPGQPNDGRAFPYRSVRINTLVTPDIDLACADNRFFPQVDGEDFLFDLVGTDTEGQSTEFSAPLMFVTIDTQPSVAIADYNGAAENRRDRPIKGQKVAFAPEKSAGDTSLPVSFLRLKAEGAAGAVEEGLAEFYPLMEQAKVKLNAAEQMSGKSFPDQTVKMFEDFVTDAFEEASNAGEMFLEMIDGELPNFSFDDIAKAGGIAPPDLTMKGLSRLLGPVGGDLEDAKNGTFDPSKYLNEAAKLLGSMKLLDILDKALGPHGTGTSGPKIQTILDPKPNLEVIPPVLPTKAFTKLDWTPQVFKQDPLHIFQKIDGKTSLTINAEITADLVHPEASTFLIKGDLQNFDLQLIGDASLFMILHMKKVAFSAAKDKKPDLDVQVGEVEFAGVLKFVEEFRNYLSALGKEYGVEVTAEGITVALSIPIPTISVGVFSIQNISIGFGAIIPFNGDPARVRFQFCSREDPFILTVAMFGGGGFFGLEVGTDESVMLEISLEFGASVAFDIGVASGGAEIMAGIYLQISTQTNTAELTGFLRAGGNLSVLGIISITLELYLGFTYEFKTDKCIGRATFYLEIKILIFSITVSAEVERRFGGENDPTFAEFMSQADWTEYCQAYAQLENAV